MQEYAVKDAVNISRTGRVIVGLTTASWRRTRTSTEQRPSYTLASLTSCCTLFHRAHGLENSFCSNWYQLEM